MNKLCSFILCFALVFGSLALVIPSENVRAIGGSTLGPKPTFSSPSNGATFSTTDSINFDWSDVIPNTGGITYQLEFTQNPADALAWGQYNDNQGHLYWSTSSQNTVTIDTVGTWYYHVYAYDAGGAYSDWSDDPAPWNDRYIVISDVNMGVLMEDHPGEFSYWRVTSNQYFGHADPLAQQVGFNEVEDKVEIYRNGYYFQIPHFAGAPSFEGYWYSYRMTSYAPETHYLYELYRSNPDPIADAGGPYSGSEGSTINFDGSSSHGGFGDDYDDIGT